MHLWTNHLTGEEGELFKAELAPLTADLAEHLDLLTDGRDQHHWAKVVDAHEKISGVIRAWQVSVTLAQHPEAIAQVAESTPSRDLGTVDDIERELVSLTE